MDDEDTEDNSRRVIDDRDFTAEEDNMFASVQCHALTKSGRQCNNTFYTTRGEIVGNCQKHTKSRIGKDGISFTVTREEFRIVDIIRVRKWTARTLKYLYVENRAFLANQDQCSEKITTRSSTKTVSFSPPRTSAHTTTKAASTNTPKF